MYKKIVDTVAVTSTSKPLSGGRCENWWDEDSKGKHGLDKKTRNREKMGPGKSKEMKMSVEETLTTFQFKGFEFGNWMNQSERYDVFRAFQNCAHVLSDFLRSKNIGFDYNIGVAFGARGRQRFAAHYEPSTNIINMTKERGAGTLLHEYAHALDYCIGAFFDQNKSYSSLSGGRTLHQPKDNVGGQFRHRMNEILLYVRRTESYQKLKKNTNYSDYWCNSTELFARLTEAYFAYFYNGYYEDHYLVKPVSHYEKMSGEGYYLSKDEIKFIKNDLDSFFKEVGNLLNNKCTLRPQNFPDTKSIDLYFQGYYKGIYPMPKNVVKKSTSSTSKEKTKSLKFGDVVALAYGDVVALSYPMGCVKYVILKEGTFQGKAGFLAVAFAGNGKPRIMPVFKSDIKKYQVKKGSGIEKIKVVLPKFQYGQTVTTSSQNKESFVIDKIDYNNGYSYGSTKIKRSGVVQMFGENSLKDFTEKGKK